MKSATSPIPQVRPSDSSSATFLGFLDKMRNPTALHLVRLIKSFIVSFSFYASSPENDGIRVQEFFRSMERAITNHPLWSGATDEEIECAMEGLEKYVMTKLFARTFASSPEDSKLDHELFEKIQLLRIFIKPEHLDIPHFTQNEASFSRAETELLKINSFKSPGEKLHCIVNCSRTISDMLLNASVSDTDMLGGADNFLPALIYVTIKANPPQLHSNVRFIQLYRRETMLISEAEYYHTNMLSVNAFILEMTAKSLSIDEAEFEEGIHNAKKTQKGDNFDAPQQASVQAHVSEETAQNGKELQKLDNCDAPKETAVQTNVCLNLSNALVMTDRSKFPYVDARANDLTREDVENLLSLYKDVVNRYTNLRDIFLASSLGKK